MGRDEYDVTQVGEASGVEFAGRRRRQLRYHLVDHAHVVGGAACQGRDAEPADQDEGSNLRLLQHVGEFAGAVGRVYGDEDGADLGGGELGDHPLGVVGGPDADMLAFFDADGQEATGHAFHLGMKLAVVEAVAGGRMDKGFPFGEALGLDVEDVADGAARVDVVSHGQPPAGLVQVISPNPPKGLALALTQGLMGRGRRTGQARFQ